MVVSAVPRVSSSPIATSSCLTLSSVLSTRQQGNNTGNYQSKHKNDQESPVQKKSQIDPFSFNVFLFLCHVTLVCNCAQGGCHFLQQLLWVGWRISFNNPWWPRIHDFFLRRQGFHMCTNHVFLAIIFALRNKAEIGVFIIQLAVRRSE